MHFQYTLPTHTSNTHFQYTVHSNSITMSSSSTQAFTILSSPGTDYYSASLDSLPFRVIPLSKTPFERLHGRAEQYIDITTANARTSSTTFISLSPPAEPSTSSHESNWTK